MKVVVSYQFSVKADYSWHLFEAQRHRIGRGYNSCLQNMGLKEAFESLLRMGKRGRAHVDDPVSMVLLLRESKFPTLEQLREAAREAFGKDFSADKNSRYSIYQQVLFTLAKIGPHTLSFLFYTKPYGEATPEFAKALPLASQREAWAAHAAWIAVDYVKGEVDVDSKYVVLARLCSELYDGNSVGLYLPRENTFVPGEVDVRRQLNKIITYKDVDVS